MKKMLCVLLSVVMCFGMGACGGRKKVADTPETLEIYIADFGYGTAWLQPMIDAFMAEDWVKEKYPNLSIPAPSYNSEREYGNDRVTSGITTIDLFITAQTPNLNLDKTLNGKKYYEDLGDVYDSTVPGENVKFVDKMLPEFVESSAYEERDGVTKNFYSVPWVTGMVGMLYNKTQFDNLGLEVPNTTDELIALCDEIVGKGKVPFVFASQTDYWSEMVVYPMWAQYDGQDAYRDFYFGRVQSNIPGIYNMSPDVLKQQGRLEALKVVQELLYPKNGATRSPNVHENVNTMSFTQAQAQFLLGNGLMMPNGDWFASEMRETADEGVTDEFTFMHTPVISAVINNLPDRSVKDDATLSAVIDAIDAGQTSYTGVTDKDFAKIREARAVIAREPHHCAFIPSYATAMEPAKDFLRFMATDKANNIFIKYTYGASMPFKYDVKTADPDLYNSLALLHKDRLDIAAEGTYVIDPYMSRLRYLGGFDAFKTYSSLPVCYCSLNSAERKTAQTIYDDEIAFWDDVRWNNALINAGYKS